MAMSLKDLPLEQINLTSGPDKIKLRLDAMLQLRVPDDMAHSGNEEILLSLASGKLWATRSSSCSLDFFIDLDDDEELDSENWIHLVESLGHRIRDAHLWSQLFLSTSLNIPQHDDSTRISFSVLLGQKNHPLGPELHPGDWLAGNIDVQPPDGVRRGTVEGLQIRLKVQPISVRSRRAPKKSKLGDGAGEAILLSLERFEGIVTNLSETLPLAVANSFAFFPSEDPHFESILLDEPLWNCSFNEDFGASEDMLLAPCGLGTIEDDLPLSKSAVPPLLSQSSTISSISSQSSISLKRPKPSSSVITARPVQRLVEVSVHTLLEGHQVRRPKEFQNITLEPPKPTSSLGKLCPGIFNFGFKEGMASNNQFLPTITRAVSVSFSQSVQSPSLRRKLAQLGNQGVEQKEINSTSLSRVVSGRLWAMMQRKLHISKFSRKLVWDVLDGQEEEDCIDCPADGTIPDDEKEGFENLLADEDQDDDILEFEDLLRDEGGECEGSGDDGLLEFLAEGERERREIEEETDEMLFGFLGDDDGGVEVKDEGDSMMLLEDRELSEDREGGSENNMLI